MEKSEVHFDGNLFDKIMFTFFRYLNMFFLNTKKQCHEPKKVMFTKVIYIFNSIFMILEFIQYRDFYYKRLCKKKVLAPLGICPHTIQKRGE